MSKGIFSAFDTSYKPLYRIVNASESARLRQEERKRRLSNLNLSDQEDEVLSVLMDEGISSVPTLLPRVKMAQSDLEKNLDKLENYLVKIKLSDFGEGTLYRLRSDIIEKLISN